jgi:hypothetical protein
MIKPSFAQSPKRIRGTMMMGSVGGAFTAKTGSQFRYLLPQKGLTKVSK